MAARTTTTQVLCPQLCCAGCGGQVVAATYGPKSVSVAACQPLLAQGWTGPQAVLWHNQALELLTPATAGGVQHSAGLVVIR